MIRSLWHINVFAALTISISVVSLGSMVTAMFYGLWVAAAVLGVVAVLFGIVGRVAWVKAGKRSP